MVSISAALSPHERMGLDTPIFIYHIEEVDPFSAVASEVLDTLKVHPRIGITSVLTLTELLVKPLQARRPGLAARYELLVRSSPNVAVVDIDTDTARRAAALRAAYQLRTADALQLAASLENGATAFVTNDARLRKVRDLTVIVLADHVDS